MRLRHESTAISAPAVAACAATTASTIRRSRRGSLTRTGRRHGPWRAGVYGSSHPVGLLDLRLDPWRGRGAESGDEVQVGADQGGDGARDEQHVDGVEA